MKKKPTPAMNELLIKSGSKKREEALAAQYQLAVALANPLRDGVMPGDTLDGIFEKVTLGPGVAPEFPLSFLAPGSEKDYVAYTIPNHGMLPYKNIEGDYVMVPTYDIGNTIDWNAKYARDARWDIVGKALRVMEAGVTKKISDDGWHTILAAGVDRNVIVYDSAAAAGQFTKRLVSLMKTVMRRNGGGNSTSINRGKLTDLYVSPEAMEDIRDWGVDQVDEMTRREIYTAPDGSVSRIFQVNLHDMDELGEGQEYQGFYLNQLGAALGTSDVELVVGLDLSSQDSFYMPVREELQVFPDETMHRQKRAGYYCWMELGFAVLDGRRVLLGSF